MMLIVYSLFAVIHLTSSLTVDIPLPTYEFARGGTGVIPCNFKPKSPNNPSVFISWVANPDDPADSDIEILTHYYTSGVPQTDISSDYADRASLQTDIAKGWANLTLKSLTSKDSRVHQCEVKIPGDSQGKLADTTKVVVLVAPSKPICAIQGKAEFYQNISLTCRSEEGTPSPTYKWQSYDVSNNARPNPPKSTDVNGVLSLYNISAETSGYYICTSTNKIGSQSCNLTLAVMPYSMSLGSTGGIIVGCAAVLLVLLIIIIICCCCRRKKDKAEEYTMGSPEDDKYTDKQPHELEELQAKHVESKPDRYDDQEELSDHHDDRRDRDDRQGRQYDSDRYDDHRSDRYDDRRSDRYDDQRSDRHDDRRNDRYDDRRTDRYDDRRSDYDDRQSDRYDDRRSDRYDDRRRDRSDDRYDDRRDRYDHRDERYNDRSRSPNFR